MVPGGMPVFPPITGSVSGIGAYLNINTCLEWRFPHSASSHKLQPACSAFSRLLLVFYLFCRHAPRQELQLFKKAFEKNLFHQKYAVLKNNLQVPRKIGL
jgi:hypothetical protein